MGGYGVLKLGFVKLENFVVVIFFLGVVFVGN